MITVLLCFIGGFFVGKALRKLDDQWKRDDAEIERRKGEKH